jgi:hypothetical protein
MECVECLVDADCDDFDPCTSGEMCVDRACVPPTEIDEGCITQVEAGHDHTCARRGTTRALCWGTNYEGALGNGDATSTPSSTPIEVVGLDDVVQLSAGGYFTCALRSDRTVVCWGTNREGQLGLGPEAPMLSRTPVAVPGLEGVVEISTGGRHACALLENGEVWCWGRNDAGQVGDATVVDRRSPTRVRNIADAVEVDAAPFSNNGSGGQHSCARLRSGRVMCWGANGNGQLGDGTTEDRALPVELAGVTDAVEVVTGTHRTCVRERTGVVTCTDRSSPRMLPFTRPISIGAGGGQRCAVEAAGTAFCWGDNRRGELGNGTTDSAFDPVPVAGRSDVVAITAGSNAHTCARTRTAAVFCWGSNDRGQLGIGVEGDPQLTPVRVVGL